MKVSLADLQLFLAYCKENSNDVSALLKELPGYIELTVSTPDGDVATARIFDADTAMEARIKSENYLKYMVRQGK